MNLTLKKWKIEGIDTLDKFKECLVKINRTLEVDNWQGEPPRYSVTSNIEGNTEILDRNIKIENNEYRYISFNIYITAFIMVVLPVPGPPVIMLTLELTEEAIASFCSFSKTMFSLFSYLCIKTSMSFCLKNEGVDIISISLFAVCSSLS